MVFLVIPLSGFQPFCDKIDIPFGRPDARRRLLLERVQDVHGFLEPNRIHRSIGVSVVRLDDLQDAGPSPFRGFAVGAVPPNCAIPRALPMSSLTAAGKLRKSRFEDPTQCSGFSSAARTRRTSKIIPVLGYSNKSVISAVTSRGGT